MAHLPRHRLNSLSGNSTPSSDTSDGSETFDASNHEWQSDSHNTHSLMFDNLDLRLDNLSLDTTTSIAEVTENERTQIESFFSGLGTEVSMQSVSSGGECHGDKLLPIPKLRMLDVNETELATREIARMSSELIKNSLPRFLIIEAHLSFYQLKKAIYEPIKFS